MFILRIIEETRENESLPFEQVIENFELGNSYSVLKRGITGEFHKEIKDYCLDEKRENEINALLCGENGIKFFIEKEQLNSHYFYYIMTENGNTFENLSHKG